MGNGVLDIFPFCIILQLFYVDLKSIKSSPQTCYLHNIAERSIKPFVIDRKNFLFSNTPKGATASAITFSIIQTAIANNLDPYAYLTYIFTEAPKMAANGEDWVEAMLPQNAPDSCKAGKKECAQA